MSKTEDRVIQILSENLNIDKEKLSPKSLLFEDLGADSLSAVEIGYEIKETFNIDIPSEKFTAGLTIRDVVEFAENNSQKI